MKEYKSSQLIKQLGKDRGSYFYISLKAELINQFENKRKTRFICTLEDRLSFQCGLNHLGDGNFFIILSGKRLKELGKAYGEIIHFRLQEDPNPLGVDMPEVLKILLEQDEELRSMFNGLSMGKKRHVIHSMNRIKNIDKKVDKAIQTIREHR
ncbi:MAG: DUF1905 domain-containing protein [Bacteroidota bacterium]